MSESDQSLKRRARVEVYSWQYCSYCMAAKRLLRQKGVEFIEYGIDQDDDAREKMAERANGRRTLPQIFINGRHVGGYMDIAHLEKTGRLDAMLAEPAPPGMQS